VPPVAGSLSALGPSLVEPPPALVAEPSLGGPPPAGPGGTAASPQANAVAPSSGRLRIRAGALVTAIVVVLAALGLPIFEHDVTASHERSAQKHLTAQLANLEATTSTAAAPVKGKVFGSLALPRLAITNLEVVEGATLANLRNGPAHDSGSQLPGQQGAVVIVGHRATYGAPFARLGQMRVGDVISLRTPGGLFVYRVSRKPQVLRPGAGSLQLPSAAEVAASGGLVDQADQALVLATAANANGQSQSLEIVVATLDQASGLSGTPTLNSGAVVAQVRAVPGQSIGIVFLLLWLALVAVAVSIGRRLRSRIPANVVYALISIVVLVSVYQMYVAIDRLVPGTH